MATKINIPVYDRVIINGGVRVLIFEAERSFTWRINNFKNIFKDEALMNSQAFSVVLEMTPHIPQTSWKIGLQVKTEGDGILKKVWLYHQLVSPTSFSNLGVHTVFETKMGEITLPSEFKKFPSSSTDGWGTQLFELNKGLKEIPLEIDGSLVLDLSLQLFSVDTNLQAKPLAIKNLTSYLDDQLSLDFARLLKGEDGRDELEDATIISSDGQKFPVHKTILCGRSKVFAAIFKSKMDEAKSGTIKLPDITSKGLEALLYFIYTGRVLPFTTGEESTDKPAVSELIYSADKYDLPGLYQYLDLELGKLCTVENAVHLMQLSNKFTLNQAQTEIKKFISEKGDVLTKALFSL